MAAGFERLQHFKQIGVWTLSIVGFVVMFALLGYPMKHLDDGITLAASACRLLIPQTFPQRNFRLLRSIRSGVTCPGNPHAQHGALQRCWIRRGGRAKN